MFKILKNWMWLKRKKVRRAESVETGEPIPYDIDTRELMFKGWLTSAGRWLKLLGILGGVLGWKVDFGEVQGLLAVLEQSAPALVIVFGQVIQSYGAMRRQVYEHMETKRARKRIETAESLMEQPEMFALQPRALPARAPGSLLREINAQEPLAPISPRGPVAPVAPVAPLCAPSHQVVHGLTREQRDDIVTLALDSGADVEGVLAYVAKHESTLGPRVLRRLAEEYIKGNGTGTPAPAADTWNQNC